MNLLFNRFLGFKRFEGNRLTHLISLICVIGTGFLMFSCSHTDQDFTDRTIASYRPICSLEKHPEQPIYRLKMYGKTYNGFWYTSNEIEGLYNDFVLQGRCL